MDRVLPECKTGEAPTNGGPRRRIRSSRRVGLIAVTLVALTSCSSHGVEQQRLSVAIDGLRAGGMPAIPQSDLKLAEQTEGREPQYSIVAEMTNQSLDSFVSDAQLNRARSQLLTTASQDTLSGVLPANDLSTLLQRANLKSYKAENFQVIRDRVGSTYRIFNYSCQDSRCGVVIIVSTT